jgi:flagellar motor switch protein FliG
MQPALRKAAVLVKALDSAGAEAMLSQLDAKTAARIREAARALRNIDPQEQESVLADFFARGGTRTGAKTTAAPAERLVAAAGDEVVLQHQPPPAARRPFQFLEAVDAAQLAGRLRHEHPQTIALVVAHAPRRLAAELLWRLPEGLRTEVLLRVIDWQGTEPQLIEELERALELSLAVAGPNLGAAAGLDAAREILQTAQSPERSELLHSLARRDAQKAELLRFALGEQQAASDESTSVEWREAELEQRASELPKAAGASPRLRRQPPSSEAVSEPAPRQTTTTEPSANEPAVQIAATSLEEQAPADEFSPSPPAIPFSQFLRFDDRTLSRVFAAAEPQTALLALAGASPRLVDRLLRRLPHKEAVGVRRRMETLAPFPLRDIEAAQQELSRIAGRLFEQRRTSAGPRRQAA